jgi:nitrilase
MPRLAVVQQPPVLLDKAGSIDRLVQYAGEAAAQGANIVVFPEAFIPGYPSWIWRLRPGTDMSLSEQLHTRLLANAVNLHSDDLAPVLKAAKEHRVHIVFGMNERDDEFSRGTVYNSVALIGTEGALLNRHRKLMPTNPERMVWGMGDASGLKVISTPMGRIATLICWESYMPLARYALYADGVEIYVTPTYDTGERCIATMQHIAREGGCWVVSSGVALHARDIPDTLPGKTTLFPTADEWVNAGDSVVVAPGGKVIAGPLRNEYGMLYADIDLERVGVARRSLDAAGHYARPDIFHLSVNRRPLKPVEMQDSAEPSP